MANRWLRGLTPKAVGSDYYKRSRVGITLLYCWYKYCLGWTYKDQKTTGGFSFETCLSLSGSVGTLVDTDVLFSIAETPPVVFPSGAVGMYLILVDSAHAVNCGIYEITERVSDTSVRFSYYSSSYPVAATGVSWYLLNPDSLTNVGLDTTVVLESPHATIKSTLAMVVGGRTDGTSNHWGFVEFQFAPVDATTSWDSTGHAWKTGVPRLSSYTPSMQLDVDLAAYQGAKIHGYGNTDGSISTLARYAQFSTGTWRSGYHYFVSGVIDPVFETTPARLASEKFTCFGNTNIMEANADTDGLRNGAQTDSLGHRGFDVGAVWSAQSGSGGSKLARWAGWYDDTQDIFRRSLAAPNHRSGTDFDGLPLIVVGDADATNMATAWALWGTLNKDSVYLQMVAGLGRMITFDSNNQMHWGEGVCTPWNGIPNNLP